MIFLTWVDQFLENVAQIIGDVFNVIWAILCWIVYPIMSWLFSIFTRLSSVDILKEDVIEGIYGRVTIILTIVMTFYIVFEFVKYTVSPDTITDKDKGAMPLFIRIVLVVVMLAFVPTIFSAAMTLQQKVINSNVIPRVILGTDHNDGNVYGSGREFVGDVYSSFIVVDCDNPRLFGTCEDLKTEVKNNIEAVKKGNPLSFMYSSTITQFSLGIEFNGLLALIFGCFMVYVLFLYCKDIALRHIQLLFLQVIAPVAIISYISPKKDGMFQKWLKQCTTTYLDLFIRVAVLYFIILVCDVLGETFQLDQIQTTVDGTQRQISITLYLFLIAGLLMFLKKAPKLVGELFPSSGAATIGFGFSAKERKGILGGVSGVWKGASQIAARSAGTIAGISRTRQAIKDGTLLSESEKDPTKKWAKLKKGRAYVAAMYNAGKAGFTAGKDGKIGGATRAAQEKIHSYERLVQEGGTVWGYEMQGKRYHNELAKLQLQIDLLKQMETAKSAANSAIGEIKFRKQMDSVGATLEARGHVDAKVAWDKNIKVFEKLARSHASGVIDEKKYTDEVNKMLQEFNDKFYAAKDSAGNVLKDLDGKIVHTTDAINLASKDLEIDSVKYKEITNKMAIAQKTIETINNQEIKYTVREKQPDGTFKDVTKVLQMPKMNDKGQFINDNNKIVDVEGKEYYEDANGDLRYRDDNELVNKAVSFADFIGDITDEVTVARSAIESSDKFVEAQKNAGGKK